MAELFELKGNSLGWKVSRRAAARFSRVKVGVEKCDRGVENLGRGVENPDTPFSESGRGLR